MRNTKVINSRIYYLDFAKVVGAFLVVFGHLYSKDSQERLYIYAFHLPFFFLISGVFHSNKLSVQWEKYFQSLIKPTIFFIVFILLTKPVLALMIGADPIRAGMGILKNTAKLFVDGRIGVYWFLVALFWCKVMTDGLLLSTHKLLLVTVGGVIILLPTMIGEFLSIPRRLPWALLIGQALMAMPFYLCGFYYRETFKRLYPSWKYVGIFLLCLFMTVWLTRVNGRVEMLYVQFGSLAFPLNVMVFYLNGFIGSAMLLSLSLIPMKKFGIVTRLAEALIAIVGFQALFNYVYKEIVGWNQNFLGSSVATIIIMLLCYSLHGIFCRFYTSAKLTARIRDI